MSVVKIAVTIDTEEDLWGQYLPAPCPVKDIEAIPLAQDRTSSTRTAPCHVL
jgi:hypothetical protein